MSRSSLFVGIALLAGSAALVSAAPPRPLPALELVSLEAQSASDVAAPASTAPSLVREGRWLLVYVSPHSGGSGPLLRALEGSERAEQPKVVVVVAAEVATAKAMAESFGDRLQAAWYADPAGDARRALGVTGIPVVLGLEGDSIRWTMSGGVSDRRTLRSILVSWR
jgi:hypothetical protein